MFVTCGFGRVVFIFAAVLFLFISYHGLCRGQLRRDQFQQYIERPDDLKKFKALLRTKNNVLVLFSKTGDNAPAMKRLLPILGEVGEKMFGKATVAVVNCGTEEGKKLCKKLKATPEPVVIKHYNSGEFNKDYDRSETVDSLIRFLNDPTGELPWEDEADAKDILHVPDVDMWVKILRKEKLPILVMFYAPWCAYCKRMKPDFASAATELKGQAVLAGIDATRPDNYPLQQAYNITGFPTLLYFQGGEMQFPYAGASNSKDAIVQWMKNPKPVKEKSPEQEPEEKPWAEDETSAPVVHLTDDTFEGFTTENPSVLVMFYAPWCGHCMRMKGDVVDAAKRLKADGVRGAIAAVDATKEKNVAAKYEIGGYPTVKYFKDGKFAWDYHERKADEIVTFMKEPKEPPPPPPPEQPWHETVSDVVHLSVDTFKVDLKKRKHAIVMFYTPWCGHCKAAKPEFTKAAARFKDDSKVMFGAVDCTIHASVCEQQGVSGYPTIKYFSYLKVEEPYDAMRMEVDFVTFMAKKIDPSAATAPSPPAKQPEATPPEPWDSSVQLLSPSTFDSTLNSYERSIVMYYAPWCGHCKKAKPEYIQASKDASNNKNVGFAAVDCAANADLCKQKQVQGYPTFHIYANGKFERAYEGARSSEGFLKAVQSSPTPAGPSPAKVPEKPAMPKKQEL